MSDSFKLDEPPNQIKPYPILNPTWVINELVDFKVHLFYFAVIFLTFISI